MEKKYHEIETDGLPTKNGRYMVKILLTDEPIYDNTELCFREFVNGEFINPYYNNPKTNVLVGWYEE